MSLLAALAAGFFKIHLFASALGGLNLGQYVGHTQNEMGPTAQRHVALAGPPSAHPDYTGADGGYLGTTDDDRRGRPLSQREGDAPARVLALAPLDARRGDERAHGPHAALSSGLCLDDGAGGHHHARPCGSIGHSVNSIQW